LLRKILITGGEGQVGKALKLSLANKFKILSTSRNPSSKDLLNNITKMNIINRDNVFKVIKSFQPDIVINCAAYSDVDDNEIDKSLSHQVNVKGLDNILHSISRDTQIIQISSDYVFDGNNGPYIESDHTFPINYYGKKKLEAENLLRGSINKWSIIRPNVIYGDDLFAKSNFFGWVYKSLIKNKQISIVTDQISNPTYVKDLVDSIFQCIIMSYEGILHFGSDNYISRYEFAIELAGIFRLDDSLIVPTTTEILTRDVASYNAIRPKHSGLDTNKIEKELNINTYSTSYSLREMNNILN